jgi:hypothetical protein
VERPFTIAALAVADGPADAVGVVQLACEDDALALTLIRAGAYRRGFVPGTLAESVTVHVPYAAVRGLVRRGRALVLTFDRSVPTPFHRFALARFSDDPAETLAAVHRAHRWASTLAWAIPGPIGALAAAIPPAALVGGALGRASLALLVALLTGASMRALAAWLAWGGPVSDRHREAFETAISERLGLLPPMPRPRGSAAARPPVVELEPPAAPQVAWMRIVGLAGIAALGLVVALAFVRRFGTTTAPPAPELDDTALAARVEAPPKPPPPPPPPPEERCFCTRADSSLWREGMPVLSVMTTTGPDGAEVAPTPRLDEHDNPVFGYDVAVVNNGARKIRETRIVLTYAQRDAQNRRVAVTDRGLYWGDPLTPGAAIKWTTEGTGTELRVDKNIAGTLEERGIQPAPADRFFALLRARHRVVRVHGAMMLAYLHDPRAEEALDAIGATMAGELAKVRRIRAAAKPIVACDVKVADGRLSACVFNASTKPGTGLSLRELQDDENKPARAWSVAPEVPLHDGVRVAWPLDGEAPADVVVAEPQ